MSAGCIPRKKDRQKALGYVVAQLEQALGLLKQLDGDPDSNPRQVEDASILIEDAQGQRGGEHINTEKEVGLEDLIEHYFS